MTKKQLLKEIARRQRHIARTEQVQRWRRAMLRKLKSPSTPADERAALVDFITNERDNNSRT